MAKIISAREAAKLIKDESTVVASGFGLACWPEEIGIGIKENYLEEGHPKNITLMHSTAIGNRKTKGIGHFAHEGLVKRWIGAITIAAPEFASMIEQNKLEAYNLPQGVIAQLYREIASGRPGVITKVGLGTYVDPRIEGGKLSPRTVEDIVKVVDFEGEEWLFYKSFPLDVAIIRGTIADEAGNLTMSKEGLLMEVLPIAQAVKNSGGIVIAQVEGIASENTIHPKDVKVPGILIDYLVVSKPENHFQTEATKYNPGFSGELKVPVKNIASLPMDERKVIARRAAMELESNTILNLGVGIPANVGSVVVEEDAKDLVTFTTEAGTIGGIPAGGGDFGHAYNPQALIDHHAQFDFYDGGGIDLSVLGLAQTDESGNINVSKFGTRVNGCGGFINISQSAKKLIFAGTFTAGGLKLKVEDGKLIIENEGKHKKFIKNVQQITFSGKYASSVDQYVLYITERAVFKLIDGKMTLIEIAPGVDLEKDILAQMDFVPAISKDLKVMDAGIFSENWGQLKSILEKK
ncbi:MULTISPECIES: acyl CoA:acetate/3-ketoacid CoA transferase [Psychrilyobacter]|uniref:Acyl CoA:acetate/3-ketoacid CoA transferase n=1 Tax=Psychrilyobacter piezotolerans TaxID=2293438 RepID=A0ABX9KI97_9FUSO|nr:MULTISPECIES: acyl CoA:acetate/3-ketoacid CoA transferase [Psychrilyobacter]MCS5422977.1 acyl CoA:acetate/3-ketoacid CoA transferase [Psychrilyobacter sp. S5]NDI77500.1 acyl CoA:acetate/3-ketoacid CoA transferase [Psychrilyobacter piezotolerans]RDE62987.1 acyl CoA:acetate/3-ketoacid CoA transferase [Psychrilyobacter sp. S5]REI41745.1 acyl CoA:acetate/3-ketoacid CoA transferase [Psychrilyobacter piezotolerans]